MRASLGKSCRPYTGRTAAGHARKTGRVSTSGGDVRATRGGHGRAKRTRARRGRRTTRARLPAASLASARDAVDGAGPRPPDAAVGPRDVRSIGRPSNGGRARRRDAARGRRKTIPRRPCRLPQLPPHPLAAVAAAASFRLATADRLLSTFESTDTRTRTMTIYILYIPTA